MLIARKLLDFNAELIASLFDVGRVADVSVVNSEFRFGILLDARSVADVAVVISDDSLANLFSSTPSSLEDSAIEMGTWSCIPFKSISPLYVMSPPVVEHRIRSRCHVRWNVYYQLSDELLPYHTGFSCNEDDKLRSTYSSWQFSGYWSKIRSFPDQSLHETNHQTWRISMMNLSGQCVLYRAAGDVARLQPVAVSQYYVKMNESVSTSCERGGPISNGRSNTSITHQLHHVPQRRFQPLEQSYYS